MLNLFKLCFSVRVTVDAENSHRDTTFESLFFFFTKTFFSQFASSSSAHLSHHFSENPHQAFVTD